MSSTTTTTPPITKVLLIGGTGAIGSLLISPLSRAFDLSLLTRPDSTSTDKLSLPSNVSILRTSYDLASLTTTMHGFDAVISTLGAASFSDQKLLIDAAVAAGVRHFLPSEFSMNTLPQAVRELVPVFERKMEVLEYLREKEGQGQGKFSWTGVATGPVLDWGLGQGFLGFDLQGRRAKVWDGGETRWSGVTVEGMGEAVVGVLRHSQEPKVKNRYVYVSSATVSQNEILEALEREGNGEKWEVEHVQTQKLVEGAREALGKGDMQAAFVLVQASAWGNGEGLGNDFEKGEERKSLVNDLLGVQQRKIGDIVKEVVGAQG